jgi:hypothetical protein
MDPTPSKTPPVPSPASTTPDSVLQELDPLPALADTEAWSEPPTEDDLRTTVASLFWLLEPDASPERVVAVRRVIGLQGYTRAELSLVAQKAAFRRPYGKRGVHPDIIEDVVRESREQRALHDRRRTLTEADRQRLLGLPGVLPDRFRITGYTPRNEPLYRYCPDLPPAGAPATPLLAEAEAPRRLRNLSTEVESLGDLASHLPVDVMRRLACSGENE